MPRARKSQPPRKAPATGKDPTTGRFLPGNRFWEARSSAGPNPKFDGPEPLWQACVEYFEWVEANPLYEAKMTSFQGVNTVEPMPKMRAMTVGALCLFLDIDYTTWQDWKKNRADLSKVIARAEEIIRSQKFAGAAADLLNANIIARDLGLADKSELTGKDGAPIEYRNMTEAEIDQRIAELTAKLGGK